MNECEMTKLVVVPKLLVTHAPYKKSKNELHSLQKHHK